MTWFCPFPSNRWRVCGDSCLNNETEDDQESFFVVLSITVVLSDVHTRDQFWTDDRRCRRRLLWAFSIFFLIYGQLACVRVVLCVYLYILMEDNGQRELMMSLDSEAHEDWMRLATFCDIYTLLVIESLAVTDYLERLVCEEGHLCDMDLVDIPVPLLLEDVRSTGQGIGWEERLQN